MVLSGGFKAEEAAAGQAVAAGEVLAFFAGEAFEGGAAGAEWVEVGAVVGLAETATLGVTESAGGAEEKESF